MDLNLKKPLLFISNLSLFSIQIQKMNHHPAIQLHLQGDYVHRSNTQRKHLQWQLLLGRDAYCLCHFQALHRSKKQNQPSCEFAYNSSLHYPTEEFCQICPQRILQSLEEAMKYERYFYGNLVNVQSLPKLSLKPDLKSHNDVETF